MRLLKMGFRISIGQSSCKNFETKNPILAQICSEVMGRIQHLNELAGEQLSKWNAETQESLKIGDRLLQIRTYSVNLNAKQILMIVQAFYPTWSWPNFFSFTGVGKLFSEGIVIDADGNKRAATDKELSYYR